MATLSVLQPQLPEDVLEPLPSDPNARSYFGGTSTTIYFVNDLPNGVSAKVYSIDERGVREFRGDSDQLRRSEYFEVTAYTHRPWEVVFSSQRGTVTKIYQPQTNPARVLLNTSVFPAQRLVHLKPSDVPYLRSVQDSRSTSIKFVNLLGFTVSIRWVDFRGNRRPYGLINPGYSSIQPTYVGQLWEVVTADIEKKPIVLFYAVQFDGLAEIDDRFLKS